MCYYQVIWLWVGILFTSNLIAGEIQGRITVSGNQRPLVSGVVLLNPVGAVQRPGTDGSFQFKNIPDGEYDLLYCSNETLTHKTAVSLEGNAAQIDFAVTVGDLDQNGQIDLIDLGLFATRLGPVSVTEPLDSNDDQNLTTADLDLWYQQSWQSTGHWYSYTLLDDAEHTSANPVFPPQGKWQTYHDTGSSYTLPSSSSPILPGTGGFYSDQGYRCQYLLGSAAQYPFAMIRLLFGANDNVVLDVRKFAGFTVVLKGEGQPLVVSLKSAVTSDDWSEYLVKIPAVGKDWQMYNFDFREHFRQPDWGGRETIENVLQTLQAIQFKADDGLKTSCLPCRSIISAWSKNCTSRRQAKSVAV